MITRIQFFILLKLDINVTHGDKRQDQHVQEHHGREEQELVQLKHFIEACVNFINILQAAFSCESALRSFYVLTVLVCTFLQIKIGKGAAC